MEEKKKYLCKICGKSFLNGRVLGGHMRGHLAMNSAKEEAKLNESDMGFQDGSTSYGLRENPKKSWKFSRLNCTITTIEELLCSVCGKEFESEKALYGHMRHHSRRERKAIHCKECGKGFLSRKSLSNHTRVHLDKLRVSTKARPSSRHNPVAESLSDIETVTLVRRKRSSRRYKITSNYSFSSLNESSSGTEIEQEVEDVAICLMMLSRDKRNWRGFNSVSVFSNNDSATFEVKSLSHNKRIARNEGGDFVFDGDECSKQKKPRLEKLDSCVLGTESVLYEKEVSQCSEFDSADVCDEEMKAKLQVPIERFYKGVGLKMPEVVDESGFVLYGTENDKGIHGEMEMKLSEVELSEDLMQVGRLEIADSIKKARLDACDAELGGNSCNKVICSPSDPFQCRTCNKIFHSYQALGGHQRVHRTSKNSVVLKIGNSEKDIKTSIATEFEASCKLVKLACNENSVEQEMSGVNMMIAELKESKEHKCPICLKVFLSGQALGGHKRSHWSKNSETREKQTIVVKQELSDISHVFDLKSPVMLDEEVEANSDAGFKRWWAGSDCRYEPLVDLVAN